MISTFSLFFLQCTVSKHVLCGSIFTCVSPCSLISVFTSAMRYEPLSALANDGQLKAHSQDSNQIYSLLIGLEEAGGRAFISVSSFLFLSSCLRFGLCAGVACSSLSDGQKEELSAELGVRAEPTRARSAALLQRHSCCSQLWWVTMFCLQAEDLSTDRLNERMLSTDDTESGKQKGRAKSETSLSSFPLCQRIHSPVARVQCQTKHVTPCFSCANSRTKNRNQHQLEQKLYVKGCCTIETLVY